MEEAANMKPILPVSAETEKVKKQFRLLLAKANKEHPQPTDVKALSDLLYKNKGMELWKEVMGMGALAEYAALENILGTRGQGSRECWKQRLESMRSDLGYASAPPLERLLIQHITLCWLNLNATEYKHSNMMKESITLTLGMYWEKRLTGAQKRFTRACESLARVRRLSHRIPIQVNIAANGGQQINVAEPRAKQ
jgi:hypothetical protein